MANVFGIITAIVLALSAFVAHKNKGAYETKISDTKTWKEKLTKSTARLKANLETEAALPDEIAGVDATVEKLKGEETAQNKVNADLKEKVDATTTQIAANKEKLDGIREKTEATGNIDELAAKLRSTSAEIEELKQSISGAEAKLANVTAQNTSAEGQITASRTRFENFASGRSLPGLKTRIRSIYPNWGFVTLASGNGSGVVTNSTLDVVRGGETVAKLLVTGVESNSSSATIVPDSLGSDVTLMVGDSVVPGEKLVKPVPAKPTSGN